MTKRLALAALLVAIAVVLYFLTRPTPQNTHGSVPVQPVLDSHEGVATPEAPAARQEQAAGATQPKTGRVVSEGERLHSPAQEPQLAESAAGAASMPAIPKPAVEEITGPDEELENVQFMVRGYRDVLGENPVGNNAEITRALMGQNARQVKMPLPVGSHLNENGELVDRWGTAYFFHQISGTQMEVRSAGADQQLWTSDDLVTR